MEMDEVREIMEASRERFGIELIDLPPENFPLLAEYLCANRPALAAKIAEFGKGILGLDKREAASGTK